jgi:small-conductance mechanosensitive channel
VTSRASDLQKWFDDHGSTVATHAVRVVVILLAALVIRALLHRAINRLVSTAITGGVFQPLKDRAKGTVFDATPLLSERRRQRTETLGSLLRSVASFTVVVVTGSTLAAEGGVNLAPILASAGIIGVAVAFGAQNLVRDVLTGIFMLLEDQYGVGDVIDVGQATGKVEAVSLRTTRLRDVEGTVWHVRNGEISRVGNKSQGWARAVLDIPLPTDSDVTAVRALVLQVAHELSADVPDKVIEEPEVWGVQTLAAEGLTLRVSVKTVPLQQWSVERELRERLVKAFAEHHVKLRA